MARALLYLSSRVFYLTFTIALQCLTGGCARMLLNHSVSSDWLRILDELLEYLENQRIRT